MPKAIHRSANGFRCELSAFHTASKANGATNASPNRNPPWRLAQSAINGSNQKDGAWRRSLADTSPLTHPTITGHARTCGRARKWFAESNRAANAIRIAYVEEMRRLSMNTRSAKLAAMDIAART